MPDKLKIEFGCGGRQMDGWICTEIETCDIRKPLEWPDESAEMLYLSHTLEHVTSAEAMKFLKEAHRILIPEGIIRIVVPAINTQMTREHVQDLCEGHGHCQTFSFSSLRAMLYGAAFDLARIVQGKRTDLDVHYKTIGDEKDALESLYVSAMK